MSAYRMPAALPVPDVQELGANTMLPGLRGRLVAAKLEEKSQGGQAASRDAHNVKIAGSIPAPANVLRGSKAHRRP